MAKWRDYLEPGETVSLADTPEPEADVPHARGVLFGAQVGWSPEREGQKLGQCDICGNGHRHTPIESGSRLYCAGCGRSGMDGEIVAILDECPAPKPDAVPPQPHAERGKITLPERFRPTTK